MPHIMTRGRKRSLSPFAGCTIVALLLGAGPIWAAGFDDGLEAFRAGDVAQAFEIWAPLADAGEAEAQHAMGRIYEYGYGVARDDAQAALWYRKAAEQNVAEAQYRLGVFHEHGWGVPRDAALAVAWYARAAQLGHVFAQHDLAFMYLDGKGVEQSKIDAYKWLRIAATQRADLMAKHLFNVSKTMTPAERRSAEQEARAWLNAQDI